MNKNKYYSIMFVYVNKSIYKSTTLFVMSKIKLYSNINNFSNRFVLTYLPIIDT